MFDTINNQISMNFDQTIESISILNLITTGGVFGISIMIVLLILFVITFYIFFERYFVLQKNTNFNSNLIDHIRDFIHEGKIESAIHLCKTKRTPEARMIQKGLFRLEKNISEIKDAIEQTGQLEIYKLEKNISVIGIISGVAPMLGFLGTVVGMVLSFYELANSTEQVNIKLLSSGIYTAMGTTAAGLIVGIFAYIFYNVLVSQVGKAVFKLQSSITDFLDLIINKPIF